MAENNKRRAVELLLPAGGKETLKTAVRFGADAVYLGGDNFGLRAGAKNFDDNELKEAVRFAHEKGVKVFVTANIYAHNEDIREAEAYLSLLRDEVKPDALLVADPGMFSLAKELCPGIPLHISTQANNTNAASFNFWYSQGAERVVAARELTLTEIREIRAAIPEEAEIECFVHGAMCMAYSGRCMLSNYFTGSDANHGACKHPCRWSYAIAEEKRPGVYLPIEENERGTYILNPDDLCMIGHVPELLGAGIDCFKVEGRMKNALYVATVGRAYRQAIDDCMVSEELYGENAARYLEEVTLVRTRPFTTGFYFGRKGTVPVEQRTEEAGNAQSGSAVYLGIVSGVGESGLVRFEQRNKFAVGDEIEILKPSETVRVKVTGMYREDGSAVSDCPHPKEVLDISLDKEGCADAGDVMRIIRERRA